jgi:hypothetical protein
MRLNPTVNVTSVKRCLSQFDDLSGIIFTTTIAPATLIYTDEQAWRFVFVLPEVSPLNWVQL